MDGLVDRYQSTIKRLSDGVQDGFETMQNHSEEWQRLHPSGFASVSRITDGNYFEYAPELIVATTTDFDDEQFDDYLEAILVWWEASLIGFTLSRIFPKPEIVATFAARYPNAAHLFLLQEPVRSGEYTLVEWLVGVDDNSTQN